jgi:hypothetical protein
MRTLQNGFAALLFCLASAAASAQTATVPAEGAAQPLVKIFASGEIRGELLTTPEGKALTAGGVVFARVKLSTEAASRRGGLTADVLIEAEQGEIAGVTGASLKEEGKARRASIEGLRKGRDRLLLIEIRLPQTDIAPTKLKVTVWEGKSGTPAVAEATWSVKDCAGGFHGALQQIRADTAGRPGDRWREAAMADPSLPKSWLFAPKEERRSRPRRGRRSSTEITASSGPNEREIFAEAGRLVRARKDPALSRDSDIGWVLGKVASGLEIYLSQPTNPAICTGALGLTDYYGKRLEDLIKRGAQLARLAADAKLLAQAKAEAAFRAVRELPQDSAGWNGATPVAMKAMTMRGDDLKTLTVSLSELAALPPDALGKVKDAATPYDGLIQVSEAGYEHDGMPDSIRKALRAAFAAIDAAARLEVMSQRHNIVQGAFEARLKAIRDAHATHCVCQS